MTYLLDDLESDGLITRRPDPRDRRARQVVITDEGRARLQRAREALEVAEGRLLSALGDDDADQLRRLLARVAHAAQREALLTDEDC